MLEPGLVGTAVMDSMGAWVKNYDVKPADQKSIELQKTLRGSNVWSSFSINFKVQTSSQEL